MLTAEVILQSVQGERNVVNLAETHAAFRFATGQQRSAPRRVLGAHAGLPPEEFERIANEFERLLNVLELRSRYGGKEV